MGDSLPAVTTGGTPAEVSVGKEHSCARHTDDTLVCWGQDDRGRLGTGTNSDVNDPSSTSLFGMGTGLSAASLRLGDQHSCAVLANSVLKWCARSAWPARTPVHAAPSPLIAGAPCPLAACRARSWGRGSDGQNGAGDGNNRGGSLSDMGDALLPVQLGSGRTVSALGTGGDFTCAILDNNDFKWCER